MPAGSKLDGLDAYEQQLASIQGNQYAAEAKYVTGNLNLWPRPLVIIANRSAYERLTADQHEIMATAAKDAVPVAMEAERAADASAVTALCKAGLTFAQSSDGRSQGIREGTRTGLHHDPERSRQRGVAGSDRRNQALAAPRPRRRRVHQCAADEPAGLTLRRHLPDEVDWPDGQGGAAQLSGRPRLVRKGRSTTWSSTTARSGCGTGPRARMPIASSAGRGRTQFFKDQLVVTGDDGTTMVVDLTYRTAS